MSAILVAFSLLAAGASPQVAKAVSKPGAAASQPSAPAPHPSAQSVHADPAASAALNAYVQAWSQVHTLTYRFVKQERMRDGDVEHAELFVKLRVPGQIYMKALKPHEGREVIYDARRDADDLVVHPGFFPDITLHLDIHGRLATGGEHHRISQVGFGYSIATITAGVARAEHDPHGESLDYLGQRVVRGHAADVIVLTTGHRPPRHVRAKDDESLFAFARRVGMDAYIIFCANPSIGSITSSLDAKDYVVPQVYGAKTQLVLDRQTHLPLQQTTWDAAGHVYEHYEYRDLVVNPPLTDEDFDPDNPAYDF